MSVLEANEKLASTYSEARGLHKLDKGCKVTGQYQ